MLKQIEGSQGVAQAVALCRPDVVCAYPISPQTHIVEALGLLCRKGVLQDCEYINVESEFAAMSVAIGASVAGGRAYTATASQGLLFMVEAIYNAGGLGLPIVMTVANRAIGAPINIWNDHSDSISQRDSGWLQLFAETNQEACDLHIQAFRIAEELSVPVMVCMDGFVLTHAFEEMDIPDQAAVDAFLPPYRPRQILDPDHPYSIGAMVGPEAFTEVRWLQHRRMEDAIPVIERVQKEFEQVFGRPAGGLLSTYRLEDAEVAVIAMGSLSGTIKDTIDEMREDGRKIGVLVLKSFRPFPFEALRKALSGIPAVIVTERTLSAGGACPVSLEVMKALKGLPVRQHTVIAGLGGRSVSKASLRAVYEKALDGTLPEDEETFLDLDKELVTRQLEREKASRHVGPVAEALNRHVNERKLARGEEI
ncbi:pyruvate ferredoxin oxidoreductase [Sutterella sp.]|uniref:pyruvate ferredoxin oxidoreductase n=1 Tax=Sutterella sp. TaxID=1981025 RepID=UPI0026DF0A15|nr:pyruvate ferredoxin oxidoreductase [Sutterella sp.]MDO5530485.1 pyruvate ferredoxin oxidoreductase [Sutterella sp.]